MSRNLGIKVGFGMSKHKYGSRSYSSTNTTVTAKTTSNTPRESDDVFEDDGAYAEDERTVSARLKEAHDMYSHD